MSEPGDRTDAGLIRLAQAGDDAAFTTLAETWHPRVLRWALGLLDDPDDADDVAQQVLVRLYTHLRRFRGSSRFSTWLYQVTRNAARDALRRRRRRALAVWRMSIADPLPPTVPDPASPLDDADLARFVRRVVRDLPDRQREVLDLVDLQGYAPTEAASLLGVSPATARVHLMRARRTLRAAIIGRDPERGEHR